MSVVHHLDILTTGHMEQTVANPRDEEEMALRMLRCGRIMPLSTAPVASSPTTDADGGAYTRTVMPYDALVGRALGGCVAAGTESAMPALSRAAPECRVPGAGAQ